jgi:hypothetical protein
VPLGESLIRFDPTSVGSSGSTISISTSGISSVTRSPPPELAIRRTVSAAPTRMKSLGRGREEDAAESRRGGLGAKPYQSGRCSSSPSLLATPFSPLPLSFATAALSWLVYKAVASATSLACTQPTLCVAAISTTNTPSSCALLALNSKKVNSLGENAKPEPMSR